MGDKPIGSGLQPVDVTGSPELLRLAEEVRETGVGRLLKRGEQELAVLAPVDGRSATARRSRRRAGEEPSDALLNIIGIGASAEPTDIARHEREYLADAYLPRSR